MKTLFFATAARGTEKVLADELRDLGLAGVEERRGGVAFGHNLEDGYRACLWSRIASRVLYGLRTFTLEGTDKKAAQQLYDEVRAIRWQDHAGPERTLAVDVAGSNSPAGPPHFVALKTKDAIVDRIRDAEGARPSIDTADADLRVNVALSGPQVIVSLDFAGKGLHRRGIGRSGAAAPLKENLAAAILRLAGWTANSKDDTDLYLFDPMCGSGTLLIEAAWTVLDAAPGLRRRRLGAEGWRGHDEVLWSGLLLEARDRRHSRQDRKLHLAGADASPGTLKTAQQNLRKAGLAGRVRLVQRELRDARPPWDVANGLVVTNPPYGARLGEAAELGPLYETLGDVLKHHFPGWTAWILCGEPRLAKRVGLRPASRHALWNGPIECRLLEVPIGEAPAPDSEGPVWRQPGEEAEALAKKLRKNLRQLRPWAKQAKVFCYRVYDTDMPLYNLAVDWYDGAVRVEEYGRPKKVPEALAEKRLREALIKVAEVFEVEEEKVVLRRRMRRRPGEQHEQRGDRGKLLEVREGDLRFLVNLTDYLDTGLFLDDRRLRARIRKQASGIDFLNLFAYTCTASVAAATGGARSTTSVDLSKTYLDWGRQNFSRNGFRAGDHGEHRLVREDVMAGLGMPVEERYDLIFVAPPTMSRSKAMRDDFDVQRDHAWVLQRCAARLRRDGEILFTTNLRDFKLDELHGLHVREITREVTSRDFSRRPRLRAWSIKASKS